MAVAERMSSDVEPIFVTRSAGSHWVSRRRHAADYIPWPVKIGVSDESWNGPVPRNCFRDKVLRHRGCRLGWHHPFPGLVDVAAVRTDIALVWVRRAMWRNGHRLDEELESCFDMIIEPGELAHDETTADPADAWAYHNGRADPSQQAARFPAESRGSRRQGIDPGRFTAAVQSGSQRNFDYEICLTSLRRRYFPEAFNFSRSIIRLLPIGKQDPGGDIPHPLSGVGLSRCGRLDDHESRLQFVP